MIVLDTNYILRFLLRDNESMYKTAETTIKSHTCFVENEVLAEVVFVLSKVYRITKYEIRNVLEKFLFLDTIVLHNKSVAIDALRIFDEKNLDFVDAMLCAKSHLQEVKTFDKKLQRCIDSFKA